MSDGKTDETPSVERELHRIAFYPYHPDDSERNHQAFARAHLKTHELLERVLKRLDEIQGPETKP